MADSRSGVWNWTTILTALVALVGGALSGGLTAYTQLSAARDTFSINRAKMFKTLTEELRSEHDKVARMALLNLWQLYPEERDQKIIITAAFETGQSDLVQTMLGFDEELRPIADMLHVRALSNNPDIGLPALKTLARVDPVRASRLLVQKTQQDIDVFGDRFIADETIKELIRLVRSDEDAAREVTTQIERMTDVPMLFDSILYQAGHSSSLVDRILAAYEEGRNIVLASRFLIGVQFRPKDAPRIVKHLLAVFNDGVSQQKFEAYGLSSILLALRDNRLNEQLRLLDLEAFKVSLADIVVDNGAAQTLRRKALLLLRGLSPQQTLASIARVIIDRSAGEEMQNEIEHELGNGLIDEVAQRNPDLPSLNTCATDPVYCLDKPELWADVERELRTI